MSRNQVGKADWLPGHRREILALRSPRRGKCADPQIKGTVTIEIYTAVSSKKTRDALKRLGKSLG